MNAGMYGMADGRGMQGRKLAGQLGRQFLSSNMHSIGSAAGAEVLSIAGLSPAVRTEVLSINGRGALRLVGVAYQSGGAGGIMDVEVFVDGTRIYYGQRSATSLGEGLFPVGYITGPTLTGIWDYVPFDSSAQVFVTLPAAATSIYLLRVIDIHQ